MLTILQNFSLFGGARGGKFLLMPSGGVIMMSEYGKDIKKKFVKLLECIEQFKGELNREELQDILITNLALSEKDTRKFIKLTEKMIPDINFYAIPNPKLFDHFRCKGKTKSKTLAKYSPQIKKEKNEMKETIKSFMELPDDAKKIIIEDWPKKYHDLLNKVLQTIPDIDHEKYNEKIVLEPYQIADIIIGDRYGLAPSTIGTYSRPFKK